MTKHPTSDRSAAEPHQPHLLHAPLCKGDMDKRKIAIRAANDVFRQTTHGSDVVMTADIQAMGFDSMVEILDKVKVFTDFNPGNDPWGEHDAGSVAHNGEKILWKIDYLDPELEDASPDPANPSCTRRVMTPLPCLRLLDQILQYRF